MQIIEIHGLTKSYGKIDAVRSVSFEVGEGEIFGLLGPNGAGKTTTMEILEGLQIPDHGVVKVFGKDLPKYIGEVRTQIGIVFQQTGFFNDLNLRELFEMYAGFYQSSVAIPELAAQFDLEKLLERNFLELSGGQRQRFILAMAVLHRPKLLFLDEPTAGLDPSIRQNFWDIILKLRKGGMTILLTTHYMEEAEIVCDRVGIIDRGRIIACDRPVKLVNSLGVLSTISFMCNKPINLGKLEGLPGVISATRDRYTYYVETEIPERSLRELLELEKDETAGKIFNLQVQQATLEDVFLKLTGHSLRE